MATSNDSNNGFKVGDIVYYPMLGRKYSTKERPSIRLNLGRGSF